MRYFIPIPTNGMSKTIAYLLLSEENKLGVRYLNGEVHPVSGDPFTPTPNWKEVTESEAIAYFNEKTNEKANDKEDLCQAYASIETMKAVISNLTLENENLKAENTSLKKQVETLKVRVEIYRNDEPCGDNPWLVRDDESDETIKRGIGGGSGY